jgi:hypothetical protein
MQTLAVDNNAALSLNSADKVQDSSSAISNAGF